MVDWGLVGALFRLHLDTDTRPCGDTILIQLVPMEDRSGISSEPETSLRNITRPHTAFVILNHLNLKSSLKRSDPPKGGCCRPQTPATLSSESKKPRIVLKEEVGFKCLVRFA